jgi:hypothetical protein
MGNLERRITKFLVDNPTYKIDSDAARIEMQMLHNEAFPTHKEYSRNCCGCRARMWFRLKGYRG